MIQYTTSTFQPYMPVPKHHTELDANVSLTAVTSHK